MYAAGGALTVTARFLTIAAAVAVVLLGAGSAHQTAPVAADGELEVSVRNLDTSQFPTVKFLTKVVDRNGRPVAGLTAEKFSLHAKEKDIRVIAVQGVVDAQVGISSLLVIDSSGSMAGTPIVAARQAAAQYVQALQPVDEVAVMAFADGAGLLADFTADFAAVQGALGGLQARGNTALYQAVFDSATAMAGRSSARRVVLLISDGENFGAAAPATRVQAIDAVARSGVAFYVIGLGPSIDRQFLQQVADASVGRLFIAPTSDQLASLFSEISELLRSEYVVTADLTGSGLQGQTSATLVVTGPGGNGQVKIDLSLPILVPQPVETVGPAGGGGVPGWLVGLLAVLAVLGGTGWLVRRPLLERVWPSPPPVLPVFNQVPPVGEGGYRPEAPPALLRLESGEEFPLGELVTLGVDSDCTYRLPLSPAEFGHGELRVWLANQRFLIHDVSSRPRIKVNGRAVSWSILADGDEIQVRGLKLRFVSAARVGS